jgi:hypothetical protein
MSDQKLGAPDGTRRPQKRNVFEMAQTSNTQLCPIFPYLGEGAIVPAVIVFKAGYRGGPDAPLGGFYHQNSVDEVMISFSGFPGFAAVGGRTHPVMDPVDSFGAADPDFSMIGTVTQRQVTGGKHQEAILLRCAECNHKLLKHDFDVDPADADAGPGPAQFETLTESNAAVQRYNADESLRTCSKCGHINDPFPVERWGWDAYAAQSSVARRAKPALLSALD